MKFKDIKPFTSDGSYAVDHPLDYLDETIERYKTNYGFNMDADYQRGHVWTEQQQIAFVEYFFKGGKVNPIYLNAANWMSAKFKTGPLELVDGKQRITALLKFLRNEIPVFGCYRKDFKDRGTPHSLEELERVRNLLNSA